jgi:hypothetical protein
MDIADSPFVVVDGAITLPMAGYEFLSRRRYIWTRSDGLDRDQPVPSSYVELIDAPAERSKEGVKTFTSSSAPV